MDGSWDSLLQMIAPVPAAKAVSHSGAVLDHVGRYRPRHTSRCSIRENEIALGTALFVRNRKESSPTECTIPAIGLPAVSEKVTRTRAPARSVGSCAASVYTVHRAKVSPEIAKKERRT